MSNFAALAVIVGLFIANVFLVVILDRWVEAIVKTIVTGVIRGVQVPMGYRRRLLQGNFLTTLSGYLAAEGAIAIGWIVMGRHAAHDEVRWMAYLFAFPNVVAFASLLMQFPFYYRYLAGILRDGEVGS